MKRVHLLVERDMHGNPHGAGQIRLLRPFAHPRLQAQFAVSSDVWLPQQPVDIVIVERGWRADTTLAMADELVAAIRQSGARLVYTLDDNLLDLHLNEPWFGFSTHEKRNIVRYFLRHADLVVVSTEPLRQRVAALARQVVVLPNALDDTLWTAPPVSPPAVLTFGYMGTHSHLDDLLLVLEPLRAAMHAAPVEVEFQLVGISEDARITRCFDGLRFEVRDTGGQHFYPDFVPWAAQHLNWHFAIAPLTDSAFARSKSDIKYLDYALLGIPAIFSDVEAYRYTVRHERTGLLVPNTPADWQAALLRLMTDAALRRQLAQAAREQVQTERTWATQAVTWVELLAE